MDTVMDKLPNYYVCKQVTLFAAVLKAMPQFGCASKDSVKENYV